MPTEPAAPAPPPAVARHDTDAAVRVLKDPAGPGRPWTDAEIARLLPLLAEDLADPDREPEAGPSGLEAEAWGTRWLVAVATGEVRDDAA